MPTLKMDGLNFCVLLLGLRNDFYLHQIFPSFTLKLQSFRVFFYPALYDLLYPLVFVHKKAGIAPRRGL